MLDSIGCSKGLRKNAEFLRDDRVKENFGKMGEKEERQVEIRHIKD